MKANELIEKNVEELKAERLNLLREQFKLRIQLSTGQLETPHLIKKVRRDIARVNSVLNQKVGA